MLNEVAALVAIVSVIAAPRAGVAAEPSTQERAWLTHTDPEAGLEVAYPADWEVIVAEQRLGQYPGRSSFKNLGSLETRLACARASAGHLEPSDSHSIR